MSVDRKVLILDIDGVLNTDTDLLEAKILGLPNPDCRALLNRGCLAVVQHIVEQTDCEIVLSSTWRLKFSLDEIHNLFTLRGCTIPREVFTGVTPCHRMGFSSDPYNWRGSEIREYVDEHEGTITSLVIIDDKVEQIERAGFVPLEWESEEPYKMFGDGQWVGDYIHVSADSGITPTQGTRAALRLGLTDKAQVEKDEYDEALRIMMGCMV